MFQESGIIYSGKIVTNQSSGIAMRFQWEELPFTFLVEIRDVVSEPDKIWKTEIRPEPDSGRFFCWFLAKKGGKGRREDSGVRWEEEGARSGRRDEGEEVRGGRKKK